MSREIENESGQEQAIKGQMVFIILLDTMVPKPVDRGKLHILIFRNAASSVPATGAEGENGYVGDVRDADTVRRGDAETQKKAWKALTGSITHPASSVD